MGKLFQTDKSFGKGPTEWRFETFLWSEDQTDAKVMLIDKNDKYHIAVVDAEVYLEDPNKIYKGCTETYYTAKYCDFDGKDVIQTRPLK